MILFSEALAVEALLYSGFSGAAVARCARYARILRYQLADDPDLSHGNHVLASPAFLVGRVLLAECAELRAGMRGFDAAEEAMVRMERLGEMEDGVRAVAVALDRYATAFGLQPRKLARKFAEEMLASGLSAARQIQQAEDEEKYQDDAGDGAAIYFADAVLQGNGATLEWIPAPGKSASVDFAGSI
ncbi:hypothetical protein DFJ74DRAFT_669475 [Hyaloraphidium curvatum]|nr:hypothetical protein DFJ74DRAFT_669475 [Hyaloraphidium curvatum]